MCDAFETDANEADPARHMLDAGVLISEFEARFEREGGLVSDDFHREWETVVARWWKLAARHEDLSGSSGKREQAVAYSASVARMSRPPQGSAL